MNIHPLSLSFVQAYLLETPGGLLLVDSGTPGQERAILQAMQQVGRSDLKLIFITHAHADHFGSAAALRRLTGAPLAIHHADAQAMASGKTPARSRKLLMRLILPLFNRLSPSQPTPADILLEDGDTLEQFGLPGMVVHTPGHTPGSCCLVLEDQSGFVGDLVSTNGQPHLQHRFIEDGAQLRQSYLRLRQLKLEKVYPGHGRRMLDGEELVRVIDAELDTIQP